MFFRKGSSVLIAGFGFSLSHEMRIRPCHDSNEAHKQFYPWTFVGRDAHRRAAWTLAYFGFLRSAEFTVPT